MYKELHIIDIQNLSLDFVYESINNFRQKNPDKFLTIITGPTVSGKTDLSIHVAKKFDAEIISADSRQIYRRLNIGTNKIDNYETKILRDEQSCIYEGISHYMVDILDPEQSFSVSDFVTDSKRIISKIHDDGKIPLIVGGTGYYIKNLIDNKVFEEYEISDEVKEQVRVMNTDERIKFLQARDSKMLEAIDTKNPRRLQNPIEYILQFNKPFSEIYFRESNPEYNVLIFRLNAPSEILYANADKKLDYRFSIGMVDEVKELIASGVNPEWLKEIGLEYKFLTNYLEGNLSYNEMKDGLRYAIHHYIKRQKTYLKKYL